MKMTPEPYDLIWQRFKMNNAELYRLLDEDRWEAAIPLLESLAASGDSCAQTILGTCYWLELGVLRNPAEAIRLLRNAAAAGSALAAHNLATFHICGDADLSPDPAEAKRFRELALLLGSPHV
ncbi:MAG: hypothetical protein FJW30_28920 [Acidobacteria bacterium]|nr:hypothetical protein [Acidobacteriota bacterium]